MPLAHFGLSHVSCIHSREEGHSFGEFMGDNKERAELFLRQWKRYNPIHGDGMKWYGGCDLRTSAFRNAHRVALDNA